MIKISSPEGIINAVKSAISGLASGVEGELDKKMAQVSKQAFDKAKEMAAERLFRTRQEYIDALTIERASANVYIVRLDASAAHLEEGYARFDMKPGLLGLNSSTPKKGVKTSKLGYKYRSIPFEPSGAPAKSNHPLHNTIMQKDRTPDPALGDPGRSGMETKMGDFANQFNALKKLMNKGAPATPQDFRGRAATVQPHPTNTHQAFINYHDGSQKRVDLGRPINKNLFGLTRIQAPHEGGGNKVRSAYMTFRTVSENPNQKGKWWHPGYQGAHIFPDLQKWTEDNFAKMAEAIFRNAG